MKINIKGIAEGIRNDLFPKEELKDLIESTAAERMAICNACDKKVEWPTGAHCGVCKCRLAWKTKALHEKCPIDKWLALTDKETNEKIKVKINA